METVEKHLLITGRVQGVGFRHFTKVTANRFGITGWVRNLPDGRVEALLQGTDDSVDEMVARLEEGPAMARVERLETVVSDLQKEYPSFRVRD